MSKLKSRVEEILDGINDPETLDAVRKVQAILNTPADTEAVDRLAEKVSFLESVTQAQSARIVVLEKLQKPVEVNVTADTESLTAYVTRLETLINDIEAKFAAWVKTLEADADIERKRINDAHHRLDEQLTWVIDLEHSVDQLSTTPPAFDPARIDKIEERLTDLHRLIVANKLALREDMSGLEQRISDCELAVSTDKLEPAPQRDTSWRPHDVLDDEVVRDRPMSSESVVVMRRDGIIRRPWKGSELDWDENGDSTIIAWRYAKEGE